MESRLKKETYLPNKQKPTVWAQETLSEAPVFFPCGFIMLSLFLELLFSDFSHKWKIDLIHVKKEKPYKTFMRKIWKKALFIL